MFAPSRFIIPFLAVALIFVSVACEGEDGNGLPVLGEEPQFSHDGSLNFLEADGSEIISIAIEIAETEEQKRQGLMNRRSLPSQSGMLFLYEEQEEELSFWMRNTPMPLDIIFADEDGWVVHIAERTTPYSDEQITSVHPAQYAVEVRAGFAERHNLTGRDSIQIDWHRH